MSAPNREETPWIIERKKLEDKTKYINARLLFLQRQSRPYTIELQDARPQVIIRDVEPLEYDRFGLIHHRAPKLAGSWAVSRIVLLGTAGYEDIVEPYLVVDTIDEEYKFGLLIPDTQTIERIDRALNATPRTLAG